MLLNVWIFLDNILNIDSKDILESNHENDIYNKDFIETKTKIEKNFLNYIKIMWM